MGGAEAATSELLRPPGLSAQRELQLSGEWGNQLCLWLQCPLGALRSIGWPMVLIPEVIDRRFRLAESSLQVYQRVTWGAEMPRTPFTLESRVAWVSARTNSVEVGLASRARGDDGAELASSLLVTRAGGAAESWGERDVPALPEAGALARRRSLVVDENQVKTFANLAGTRYPIHDDLHYAWAQGYPNIFAQVLVLVLIQLHVAGMGPTGRLEMWFRRAVPAGSLLEVCRSEDDPSVWAFRLQGTGEVGAVARMGGPPI